MKTSKREANFGGDDICYLGIAIMLLVTMVGRTKETEDGECKVV